ncbi:MAG: VOC family protein [Schleiferilactobacillus perolens]|jgi:catechol 2,3-dioxygenase|uniref:Glyoxalase bleomycin resistance protein dioxygenase n=1 Tax=Schleiferilactobacillus perolens DSM 12744 TaxID=1423792 RepID=A0A0R1N1T8_9LACO|nr:VOC family protein [Schleiferilactobacillus perolens]KRL14278.1 glyoxalase bleomycin resistance protein dioxygenase [Schleiferilactobacillus perolens DSM 12744]MCI1914041.1 VOC family protein [Schleiferilactobacillus harbinensis]
MSGYNIADETRIGFVALKVKDLQAMLDFYSQIAGLALLKRSEEAAYLGARQNQEVLVTLHKIAGEKPKEATAGLEHFAILLPDRNTLGSALQHMVDNGIAIDGVYENAYSQTFIIHDPEGNGVEFAYDKSAAEWRNINAVDWHSERTVKIPLDNVLNHQDGKYSEAPAGVNIGHVQLRVNNLKETANFYEKGLGFSINDDADPKQLFLAAGDYHHHIGVNLADSGQLARPAFNNYGLDFVNLVLPNESAMDLLQTNLAAQGFSDFDYNAQFHYLQVTDPNGINLWFSLA